MKVCHDCGEWKEHGKQRGRTFTCNQCLMKIRARQQKMPDRRQRLPDGTIHYPCGHTMSHGASLQGVTNEPG